MNVEFMRITERPKPPRLEELSLRFSDQAVKELESLLTHYPDTKSAILPALWIAQREYEGYLTPEAIAEVAARLNRSYAEIEGVATFYTMYNKLPVGKYMIEVCTNLTCMVCGAYRLVKRLQDKLGIKLGETTPDGMFTLTEVECLNNCGDAPVIQVGDVYMRKVTEDQLDDLIASLRSGSEHSATQLANAIVEVQVSEEEYRKIEAGES